MMLPTAAAPANLWSMLRLLVETDASKAPEITSYTPTTFASHAANTTRLPTAAAPQNLASMVRLPVEMDASNVRAVTSYTPTASAL